MGDVQYRDAYCEVLYLINNMQIENKNKISKKFIEFLEKNKNENYIFSNISLQKPETLKNETKIILSLIYRNYFCTKEEQIKMAKEDNEELNKRYYYDNIFNKNKKVDINKQNKKEISLIRYSKFREFISNIKNKIISVFKR